MFIHSGQGVQLMELGETLGVEETKGEDPQRPPSQITSFEVESINDQQPTKRSKKSR